MAKTPNRGQWVKGQPSPNPKGRPRYYGSLQFLEVLLEIRLAACARRPHAAGYIASAQRLADRIAAIKWKDIA